MSVRWGNAVSGTFKVTNGIRQGGLLSPFLFNVYVDKLSVNLNGSSVGCVIYDRIINHLSYADDMVLIAPSIRALKNLVHICEVMQSYMILYTTLKKQNL